MKRLLNLTLILITLSLVSIKLQAQTTAASTFNLSLGIEPGLPTTTQFNYTAFTLGGTVRLQYGITNNLSATFTTGGYHFFSKTITGTNTRYSSFGIGPVKAGLKEFFIPNFYINAEAGVGVEVTEQGFSGGHKKLLLSPGFGYGDKHWDVGFHFESLIGQQYNYGIFGVRIAYGFKL